MDEGPLFIKIIKYFFFFILFIIAVTGAAAGYIYLQLPSEKEIRGCITTTMYHVHLCPGSNTYVPLKQISPFLQKSVVLTEDSNFFNHNGFDWEAIQKDAKENWEKGKYKRGGSTITQQLAKNMFLYKEKSLFRKGLEALITQRIEKTLKKKEILERYLNVVEFGKDIYGVKAAAQFYFKKSPAQLNVVESAFLTMILPNPEKYARSFFKKDLTPFARKRITTIVTNMYKYNRIDQTEYDVAMTQVENFFNQNMTPPPPATTEGTPPAEDGTTLEDLENTPPPSDDFF